MPREISRGALARISHHKGTKNTKNSGKVGVALVRVVTRSINKLSTNNLSKAPFAFVFFVPSW